MANIAKRRLITCEYLFTSFACFSTTRSMLSVHKKTYQTCKKSYFLFQKSFQPLQLPLSTDKLLTIILYIRNNYQQKMLIG